MFLLMTKPLRFRPFDPYAPVKSNRRNLPHWRQAGCTYFVTFRLADSLPKTLLDSFRSEKASWLATHPKPWNTATEEEYDRRFHARLDAWLDRGCGSCALRVPAVRYLVEMTLFRFNRDRYKLDSFVVMPNHLHLIVRPTNRSLSQVLHSWKSFSAHQINRLLKRTGPFWMDENFDRIVRSAGQLADLSLYVANNPKKAKLRNDEYTYYADLI
jgi:REP element-mobilizing transposase RayT